MRRFGKHPDRPAQVRPVIEHAPPAGIWTALNQIPVPKEPLPLIESEHDNMTPQKAQAYRTRSKELLDLLVKGGEFKPKELN